MSGEREVFSGKLKKAFPDVARKRVYETGSGTCIATGERDYGFSSGDMRFSVTKLQSGQFLCERWTGDDYAKRLSRKVR